MSTLPVRVSLVWGTARLTEKRHFDRFVQMALNDEEDLVESDSDDDEEEMVFWIP